MQIGPMELLIVSFMALFSVGLPLVALVILILIYQKVSNIERILQEPRRTQGDTLE
jgi:hypothetical protein